MRIALGAGESSSVRWTKEQIETFVALWTTGVGMRRMASQLDKTPAQVSKKRFELKLPPRIAVAPARKKENAWPAHKAEAFARGWRAGKSLKFLARELEMPVQSLKTKRIQMKLTPRRRIVDKTAREPMIPCVVYMTPEQNDRVGKAALAAGMSRSAFIARCVMWRLGS